MRRIPALDGLRGVAILLVIAFHAWPEVVPSGAYGVNLFFVLSGFLITRILIRGDRVDFRSFYRNRALRLLPALVVFLLASWLVYGWWSWHPLTYTANWAIIEGVELPGMWHTWSLAVEEHFYLVWPFVVALTPRRWMFRTTAVLLGMAVAWRIVMIAADAGFQRIHGGTDTAIFAILAGCLLAFLRPRRTNPTVGLIATGGIVFASIIMPRAMGFLTGEIVVVALSALAIYHADGIRLLEHPVLCWFGKVSYGLYLWHVFFFPTGVPHMVAIGLALVVTWLSWHLVEKRFLRLKSGHPTKPVESEFNRVGSLIGDTESDDARSPIGL